MQQEEGIAYTHARTHEGERGKQSKTRKQQRKEATKQENSKATKQENNKARK